MAKKEVTSIMTVQLTAIIEVEENEVEELILTEKDPAELKKVSENMKEFFNMDDVVITDMQHFVRDVGPVVPPVRLIFDSEERMKVFLKEGVCPDQCGLPTVTPDICYDGESDIQKQTCERCWRESGAVVEVASDEG